MASRTQGLETRARLVKAATESFSERGVRGTSLDSVAATAGVTRQGLLHYFPSKTDLLQAVLEQRDRDDAAAIPGSAIEGGDLADALLAIMDHNREHPGLTQVFAVSAAEAARPEHPNHGYFRGRYEGARGRLAEAIRDLQRSGRITGELDAEVIAIALLALMYGLNVQQLLEPDLDHTGALAGIMRALSPNG